MDIETIYLFVGVFVISSFMLVVLQRLFKNKSYEEVIAEQRQHTNALFSSQPKPKVKDKKQKKALKKSKEKKSPTETNDDLGDETSDQAEHTEESAKEEPLPAAAPVKPEVAKPNHTHVEFQEATTVIEEPLKDAKRKPRRESMKPILVNRDSSSELIKDVAEVPHTNHFEESHPKDEFELFNAHNSHSQHAKEEKINAENNNKKTKKQAADKKIKHQVNEIISKKEKEKVEPIQPPTQVQPLPPKEKPIELAEVKEVKEQLAAVTVVQNGLSAVPVKDKKKKKSEFNVLTQNHEKSMNVNLPQMITLVRKADMSKQDVQTLIDVLLNKQHDAPSIIDEWSEGKGDPMQKLKKQLAEKTQQVGELQDSLTGAQNKLREVRADQQGERSQLMQAAREFQEKFNALKHEKLTFDQQILNLNMKCQQVQETANEESKKYRQMVDDFKALQVQHQQYVQQMERNVENLTYEMTNKQMQQNMQYKTELEQSLQDLQLKCESRVASDRQQFANERDMWTEKMQNLEMQKNQESQAAQKQIEEAKKEIAKVNNELRMIQENHSIMLREKEKEIAKHISLNSSNQQENLTLKDELQKVHEAKTNGSIEQGKQHQTIINQLNLEIKNVKNQLENSNKNNQQQTIELEELKNKNNDLRKKNWKVMEALNAAESRLQTSLHSQKQVSNKLVTQLAEVPPPEDPKETRTRFLKRVFPSIVSISSNLDEEQWDKAVQEAVKDYILATTTPVLAPTPAPIPTPPSPPVVEIIKEEEDDEELLKLRSENANYRKIIDQSEAILCKLQTHVEEEQIRWGRELKSKDDSISRLSEELELKDEELRQKVESLNQAITTNSHSTNGPTAGLEFSTILIANESGVENIPVVPDVAQLALLTSTDSSAASSVADTNEKTKKKKRKKNKDKTVTN